ncbi:phage tail protein [Anaerococcus tetradius]|jgi:hypothetical protein|uniref:phage tail protein n=1 Tax=Anaerococcus tetradius TaxID=33036 RepID=UPI0020607F9A|nr:phage tail protein [Anaerococcus tetradius]DAK50565.1 MAG TPA: tail protein [Caudoviricetes sp.]
MLVYKNDVDEQFVFSYYRNLYFDEAINELTSLTFEIPKEYRHLFEVESQVIEDGQLYDIKNIEPFYGGYKVESRQAVYTLQAQFNKSLNFPYQTFENILKGILPQCWSYKIVGNLKERRTITADHKDSWQVFNEAIKKFNYEYKINSSKQEIIVGKELGTDRGAYFMDDFNIDDKDITEESFEFATRIIPEGMNGLKINQINNGKDYLEDKSYSWKTITYHWKDERYTNIENLKEAAAEKLKALSRPRMTINLKVKDLSDAVGVYAQKYEVGDFVYLIDKDRKTKERFRITSGRFYPSKPFENEISLTNRPVDIVDDVNQTIELTKEMWEETRVRFETTDEAIKSSVSTAKRYTDDSFKTYKTEREQTDSRIYESITESTTYVDPKTGQTKPIIDKQLEIVKTIDSINISLKDQLTANKDFADRLEGIKANISENNININSKIDKDLAKVKKELGDSIDYTKVDFKKRHDLLALELESASKSISEAKGELGELSNKFDDFNTTAENKYQIIDKEILGIKSNFKVAREAITAEITSASKTQEQAINQMGKDTESSIKTYLNANYSTKTQTDEKISQEVGSLKTLVNADIGDLSKEITEAKSKIEQTKNSITAKVSTFETDINNVQRNVRSLSSELQITKDGLASRVLRNDIISEINQSPEQIKIRASKIDLTGNVSVRGDFTTYDSSDNVGIELKYNDVKWRDNRWENKTFGVINVSEKRFKSNEYSFMIGHYPTSQLDISYYDNNYGSYFPYITFDRWNYTGDGGTDHPIIFNEGVYMPRFHKLFLGDIVFETNFEGELKIHHKSRNAGVKIDSSAIYAYYASAGRDVNKEIARF